jgi:hypothetical protein
MEREKISNEFSSKEAGKSPRYRCNPISKDKAAVAGFIEARPFIS